MASPLFRPEYLEGISGLLEVLREVADAHSATSAQVALAWVIRHPAVAAIPGASSVEQLESNVAAADIELADDEYDALRTASDQLPPIPGAASIPRRIRALYHGLAGAHMHRNLLWNGPGKESSPED
jgi:diketogulonate reductase-like aldo/keto reductase